MQTELLAAGEGGIEKAAALLRAGQVVAIPTETVYGLAANALSEEAVARIFEAKGRPQDNPLIVHIAGMEELNAVAAEVPKAALALAEAFWPGPLTMILPRGEQVAPRVSAGLDTVGVRMPANAAAQAIIKKAGVPLAAPSANLSGSPSPTTARHVLADMEGRIPLVVDGGDSPVGVESTVLRLGEVPCVLRPGFITPNEIAEVLGQEVEVIPTVNHEAGSDFAPQSPGMKYKHYAPKAEITIVDSSLPTFIDFIDENAKGQHNVFALCFEDEAKQVAIPSVYYGRSDDAASQAAALFGALRALDERGAQTVYARAPLANGVGLAVRNRLLRAAAFREIRL